MGPSIRNGGAHCLTQNQGFSFSRVTEQQMPDTPGTDDNKDDKKKVEGWNIRPFDRDLRIACQIQARKEDMYDYEWVQKILREALGNL
jgi:hypothetical protein